MDQVGVQIVENHAEISGQLLSSVPSRDRPGFLVLAVKIEDARPIGEWPNMFRGEIGRIVQVLAREGSQAATQRPGPVVLRVRRGGPSSIFAE